MTSDAPASSPHALHRPAGTRTPANWEWHRLDAVCTAIVDCPHSTPMLTSSGPFIARSQDIRSGVFRAETAAHVSEETYRERCRRAEPQYGDLLYSREGTYFGIAAEVPQNEHVCLGQRMVLIRPRREQIDHRYLRFWLNSPVLTSHVEGFRDGSVAERLNLQTIRSLPVACPPIAEQRRIAEVLGALDDKIELNLRMNETLETIAGAVYDDTLRLLDGASTTPIKGLVTVIQYGLTQSACEKPVGPKFLRITDIQRGRVDWSVVPFCRVSDAEMDKYAVNDGDIFVARTGASTGENVYVVNPPRSVFASYLVRFQFSDRAVGRWVAQFMRSDEYFDFVRSVVGGSAQPNASAQKLAEAEIVVPNEEAARRFYDAVRPLDERNASNIAENDTLIQLRDTLLPKLISGELRVREAEKEVAEVV